MHEKLKRILKDLWRIEDEYRRSAYDQVADRLRDALVRLQEIELELQEAAKKQKATNA
jgi:hypothetical protein